MAQITYDDIGQFTSSVFAQPQPETYSFLQNLWYDTTQALSNASQEFMGKLHDTYDQFLSDNAIRQARAAARNVTAMWQTEAIRPLYDIDSMQQAPYCMQRYLMAEPTVRNWYYEQRLDGYSNSYLDAFPWANSGEDHYDYRRVTNGVFVNDGEHCYVREYYEQLTPNDRELDVIEQFDTIKTWKAMVANLFEGNDDPTSIYNQEL